MPYELTDEQRDRYRATSIRAQLRKQALLRDHDEHAPAQGIMLGERLDLQALETHLIEAAVERSHGNLAAAARLLGLTRPQLSYRLNKIRGDI